MKLNPDDLRRQYAEYPDEFLLEIDRDDLTDVARACYDEELAKRGLAAAESDESDEEIEAEEAGIEPAETGEQVLVGRFQQPEELAEARDALTNAGIPCLIETDSSPRRQGYPYLLKVGAALREQAIQTLQSEIFNPGAELDYERHFSELSDEDLLAVNGKALPEGGRASYMREIERRGLEAATGAASEDLLSAGTFMSAEEAELAIRLLHDADIPCQLQLMVPADMLDRACEILDAQK